MRNDDPVVDMSGSFNVDVNARKQDYSFLARGEYLVTKVFATLQGEGPFAGQFAIFIRLAGCNLGAKRSCPWCDTDFKLREGKQLLVIDLLEEAEWLRRSHNPDHRRLMILTGGEPLLQNPYHLLRLFIQTGWRVQIETNGYFWSKELSKVKDEYHPDRLTVVVSPKVNQRLEYPPLQQDILDNANCFKILVDADPKSPYFKPPPYAVQQAKFGKPIYVSPINIYARDPAPNKQAVNFWGSETPLDHRRCRENYRHAANMVMQYGFILSCQTHLFAEVE